MVNIPVFTTSHPGFMGSTEARNHEFIEKHSGPKSLAPQCHNIPVYIDGELEDLLGFDMPIWLSGDITGETQKCYVWNVDGTQRYEAEITWDWVINANQLVSRWDSRGYIRLRKEKKVDGGSEALGGGDET